MAPRCGPATNLPAITDVHFHAVAENLQKTLEDFKVKPELIHQVMAIAASTKAAVQQHPPAAK